MAHNMILPTMAVLLLTTCSSNGDQDTIPEKKFSLTPTLGTLKTDEKVPGYNDGTALPVKFPDSEIVTYQGVAGITPKFEEEIPLDQQFSISGNAAIELDFTTEDGVVSGQITDLREERLNDQGLASFNKDGELDLSGKSIAEINELYDVVNTFSGDIEINGTALQSGQILANFDATLTPTEGDTSPIRIQEAVYGSVYSSEGTSDTLLLSSAITIDDKKDPAIFSGSMTSDNPIYNRSKIQTVIVASEAAE